MLFYAAGGFGWRDWMFAVLAAMWFGPKGFASVVYGLLVIAAGIPAADQVFALVALTIVVSIIAHSSTDIVVARGFAAEPMPTWRQRWEIRGRRLRKRTPGEESPGTALPSTESEGSG